MIYLFAEASKASIFQLFLLVGLIIVIGLVLGVLEKKTNSNMTITFGRKGVFITGLGVVVHELSHFIGAVFFRHSVNKVCLLNLKSINSDSDELLLGYVEHSYNKFSIYQSIGNFFIGVAPIFGGIFTLILSMYLLLPTSFNVFKSSIGTIQVNNDYMNILNSIKDTTSTLFNSIFTLNNVQSINFWLFLIIAICVSSHIALSTLDMKGASDGLIALLVFMTIINIILVGLNIPINYSFTYTYNSYIVSFAIIALFFSVFTLLFSATLKVLLKNCLKL